MGQSNSARESGKEAQGVGGSARTDAPNGAARRAQELLRGVPTTQPPLREKSSLGGILRRRVPEEDAVQSLRAEPALEVVATLQEKATLQTSFLLAKQKQVHLAGREAAKRAEDADIAHYVAVDKFSRECAAFNDVGPLLEDVQRACDLVRATVVQCAQLDELLCERLGESPAPALTFPALTSATAGSL